MNEDTTALLWSRIETVSDWPLPGVSFLDLSRLLADGSAFTATIDALFDCVEDTPVDAVLGIEARGFPYAAALAYRMGVGFVTVRKPGKLPRAVHAQDYELEYGVASLEMHQDALDGYQRVLVVDDVLATGGTAAAAVDLARRTHADVVAVAVIVEIPVLEGRRRIEALDVPVIALLDASAPR